MKEEFLLPRLTMEDVRRKREELYDVRGKKEEGRVFAAALMGLRILRIFIVV